MITLNGTWQMNCKGEDSWQEGQVPGTVYTDLLRNGQMKDPYVGENEDEVRDLSYNDYTYRRTFKRSRRNLLRQLLRPHAGRNAHRPRGVGTERQGACAAPEINVTGRHLLTPKNRYP